MCVYIYIYIHVYVYVYVYDMYIHMCVYVCIYIYTYKCDFRMRCLVSASPPARGNNNNSFWSHITCTCFLHAQATRRSALYDATGYELWRTM